MANTSNLTLTRLKKKADKAIKLNRLAEAKSIYAELCRLSPQDPRNLKRLGELAEQTGDITTATLAYQLLLDITVDATEIRLRQAHTYARQNRMAEAEKQFRICLEQQKPENTTLYLQLGITLEAQEKFDEAEAIYRQALERFGATAELCLGLGRTLRQQNRDDEALPFIEQSLQLNPQLGLAHLEMGHLLKQSGQSNDALASFEQAKRFAPQEEESYLLSSAALLMELERHQQAMERYDLAVKRHPRSVNAHWSRSLALLTLERFDEGWREYEWRRGYPEWLKQLVGYSKLKPLWQGEPLEGKRILIFAEQGFGDTIQFVRFLPELSNRGAEVHLHCQAELFELLRSFPGLASIYVRDSNQVDPTQYDYFLPLLSLPGLLKTKLDTIPSHTPYLKPDEARIEAWRQRLGGPGFKVGLTWMGSTHNQNNRRRSIQLEQLAPLMETPGTHFYSLQKGEPGEAQLAQLPEHTQITNLAPELHNFADTAAIMLNLDLIISVDTAVAHLAGALARPTWLMLYAGSDWRWLLKRNDSPWYPGLRIFRQQPEAEGWDQVIDQVRQQLSQELSQR